MSESGKGVHGTARSEKEDEAKQSSVARSQSRNDLRGDAIPADVPADFFAISEDDHDHRDAERDLVWCS